MAASASMASVLIQFLGFEWILYFRPFCNRSSSLGVNWMLVLFITRGKKLCLWSGSFLSCLVSLFNLCTMVLYLLSICVRVASFIEFSKRVHVVPQSLEACRWAS